MRKVVMFEVQDGSCIGEDRPEIAKAGDELREGTPVCVRECFGGIDEMKSRIFVEHRTTRASFCIILSEDEVESQ